ncbi:hypothetical protein K4K58_001428 [Colletotrichum sp. SAR11_239]|nr:hypothetical protein K4K58_001428 [Colletotrichum sp. SAR11_239]
MGLLYSRRFAGSPQPNPDGTCNWYKVQSEDGCWSIGESFGIDQKRIEEVNKKTWGWAGCSRLQKSQRICLSPGTPPFPPAVPDTQCGPQVLGTKKPIDGTPWEQLNPCPLKACCDVWGFCGTTTEFCTKTPADTGAPGTAKPGTNGCISNCGTNIVNNDKPPAFFRTVGYFESWNHRRPCLKMDARQIDTRAVNHVHFAFATLDKDFGVSIDDNVKEQWRQFRELKTKRVASFGGWDFSTKPDTLWRFRDATKAENRLTFAGNAVAFLIKEGIDGLDFDWEYPSAPDIDGVPPGSEAEGKNYLEFLKLVRTKLPPGKTLSIALPASFWYLKPYPLEELAKVCDYFVYMTSHINKTLTETALSMITKAGVPASKVLVGVSSYGRSFRMSQPDCFGPMCTYTGTRSRSDAYHGRCTNTGGYISNAEIEEIIESNPKQYPLVRQLFDKSSDSNILIYGTRQQADYVAFMKASVKQGRSDWVRRLNFGGTTDWAVDLMEFKQRKEDEDLPGPDGTCFRAEKTFERATQPIGQFWRPLQDTGRQYVTIVNMTPHIFELKSSPSRNFENFSWRSVPPGRAAQNTVVYRLSAGNGEASYEIRGTGKRFYVRVGSASNLAPLPGNRVVMFDLSDMGNGQREYNFPGEGACVTLVITGSASFGFVTSLTPWTGPRGWMSAIKDVIKDRSLADVVMPGTHDSGMSRISLGIPSFGSEMNTQTQALNIYDQLSFGSRWFDLRVSSVHKIENFDDFTFWSMHLDDETASFPVGNTGELFSTIIDEINKFTSEHPGEIITLQFRYLIGITSNDLLILTLGLNLYMVSENCEINKRRSPLLPGPDRGTRSVNPLISSWNGIIFANGTTIDHPPPGLHPGRLEILQNGTVFDNGTVLKEDIPNPDFNSAW